MSKKQQKRAAKRARFQKHVAQPILQRFRPTVYEPFYLHELGLQPVIRGPSDVPRYDPGPILSTR